MINFLVKADPDDVKVGGYNPAWSKYISQETIMNVENKMGKIELQDSEIQTGRNYMQLVISLKHDTSLENRSLLKPFKDMNLSIQGKSLNHPPKNDMDGHITLIYYYIWLYWFYLTVSPCNGADFRNV